MYRCLNARAIGVSIGWEESLALAKESGFEGIDVPVVPDLDPKRCRELLKRHGLKPGGAALPFDFRSDQEACRKGLASLEKIAPLSAQLGQNRFFTWIWPYSEEKPMKENFRFHVERLAPAAKILAANGCLLGLEFIGPKTMRDGRRYGFIRTMEQMLDLCEAIGPNTGLLLDAWHWHTSLGSVEDILALSPSQVVYVHINDAPAGIPVEQQIDTVRCLPGETGVIDLPRFLDALRRIGYDGPVVPEPFVKELAAMPPAEAIARVGDSLLRCWSRPARPALLKTMKAVATGGSKAWLVDLPVPRPQGSEVVIKLHASPICGSNLGGFIGDGERVNTGHEGAGEVVAVAHSSLLKVGDRVAVGVLNGCGSCPECMRGDGIFCQSRPKVHGCFAQFTRVTDTFCTKIPDTLSYERASLMGCGLGPAYEAITRLGLRVYDTVVIGGQGPVGLGATALASASGARVIALDPEPYRRELARKIGAEAALDPTDSRCKESLLALTGRRGISRAIDCSGKADTQRMLIDLADIRAIVAFVGENSGTIPVSPSKDMIRKGLTLIGCWHMNQQDAPDLIFFLERFGSKADLLVSHAFGFDQVQEAFDTFASRRSAKVLLLPWKWGGVPAA